MIMYEVCKKYIRNEKKKENTSSESAFAILFKKTGKNTKNANATDLAAALKVI